MTLSKRILQHPITIAILSFIAASYIRLLYKTGRWNYVGKAHLNTLLKEKKPFILAFWHGRLLMVAPHKPRGRKVSTMISLHRDGKLIARTVERFGTDIIEGSTSKNGLSALKAAMKILEEGNILCITPDGPRGPAQVVGGHIIEIARKTGAPILPMSYASKNCRRAKSWDQFVVPRLFQKGFVGFGEPLIVDDQETSEEAYKLELTNRLNTLTNDVESRLC